jgi:predicted transcriptional regulator
MTRVDLVVQAAMALSDDEKRQVVDRILRLVSSLDAGLEAAITEGLADIRAGNVVAFEDFLKVLQAEDRADTPAR